MTSLINVNGSVVDASTVTVPQGRTFRGAWELDGTVIEVDMPKARLIVIDRLRAQRTESYGAPDLSIRLMIESKEIVNGPLLTTEEKTTGSFWEAQRKALRDVTTHPSIAAASDADALSALTLIEDILAASDKAAVEALTPS